MTVQDYKAQLAESQARENKLLEALESVLKEVKYKPSRHELIEHCEDLIDTPSDATVLNELIAKAGEVMREQFLRKFNLSGLGSADVIRPCDVMNAIRDLPGVTMEDLK